MNEELRERLIAGYPWVSLPLQDLDNDDAWAAADVDFILSEIEAAGFVIVPKGVDVSWSQPNLDYRCSRCGHFYDMNCPQCSYGPLCENCQEWSLLCECGKDCCTWRVKEWREAQRLPVQATTTKCKQNAENS